jgi:hypothetical protein
MNTAREQGSRANFIMAAKEEEGEFLKTIAIP